MVTQEPRNGQVAPGDRMVDPTGLEAIVPSYVTGLVIIGLAASFLAVLVGLMTDRFIVVIAGSFALSGVMLVWATAAAVGLWKSAKSWLASRRAVASESVDTRPLR